MEEFLRPWTFSLRVTQQAARTGSQRHEENIGQQPRSVDIQLRATNTFHMDVPDEFVTAVAALTRRWGPLHPRIGETWAAAVVARSQGQLGHVMGDVDAMQSDDGGDASDVGDSGPRDVVVMDVQLPTLVLQLLNDQTIARKPIVTVRTSFTLPQRATTHVTLVCAFSAPRVCLWLCRCLFLCDVSQAIIEGVSLTRRYDARQSDMTVSVHALTVQDWAQRKHPRLCALLTSRSPDSTRAALDRLNVTTSVVDAAGDPSTQPSSTCTEHKGDAAGENSESKGVEGAVAVGPPLAIEAASAPPRHDLIRVRVRAWNGPQRASAVTVEAGTLAVQWNPDTIAALQVFLGRIKSGTQTSSPDVAHGPPGNDPATPVRAVDQHQASSPPLARADAMGAGVEVGMSALPRASSPYQRPKFALTASMQCVMCWCVCTCAPVGVLALTCGAFCDRTLTMALNKEKLGRHLMELTLQDVHADWKDTGTTLVLCVDVGGLISTSASTDPTKSPARILSTLPPTPCPDQRDHSCDTASPLDKSSQEPFLQLRVETYAAEAAVTHGCDSRVVVDIKALEVVYLSQLWLETVDYVFNGVLGTSPHGLLRAVLRSCFSCSTYP